MGLPLLHSALETTSPDNEQPEPELFTMDGFLQQLVRWVVVDDQVGDDFVGLDCLVFANSRLHPLSPFGFWTAPNSEISLPISAITSKTVIYHTEPN